MTRAPRPRPVGMLLTRLLIALALVAPALTVPTTVALGQESGPTLTVVANRVIGPVKDIFGLGANEHYWRPNDPVHPEWHPQYLGRTIERVRELAPVTGRPLNIRNFGTKINGEWGADGHHWESVLNNPDAWDTDPDEWMDYTKRVGGQFQYLVNFGSGTAQEAANLVEYVNGTADHDGNGVDYAAMRAQRGQIDPYNVTMWEIGNELYGNWETGYNADRPYDYANPNAKNGGDPPWHGKPTNNVVNYAARAAEFARAMRKASPTPIKLYIVGNNWDLGYWGGADNSVKALMEIAGPYVDGVVIHYYPQNAYYGEEDSDLLGRSEIFDSKLVQLRGLLARHAPPGKRMEIVVSEWNNRDKTNAQTLQLVNGLFVVDTLLTFANRQIDVANYFAISNNWRAPDSGFTLFSTGDVAKPTPTFYSLKLLTSTFGSEVVQSQISRAPMLTAPGGRKGSFSYPSLTTAASLSADHKTLTVVVVNKHPRQDITTTVNLNGYSPHPTARVLTLNGPSLNADNHATEEVSLTERTITDAAPGFRFTFPAHSATALVFTASTPIITQPGGTIVREAVVEGPSWFMIGLIAAGTLGLVGVAGAGGGAWWYLRRRRATATPATPAAPASSAISPDLPPPPDLPDIRPPRRRNGNGGGPDEPTLYG